MCTNSTTLAEVYHNTCSYFRTAGNLIFFKWFRVLPRDVALASDQLRLSSNSDQLCGSLSPNYWSLPVFYKAGWLYDSCSHSLFFCRHLGTFNFLCFPCQGSLITCMVCSMNRLVGCLFLCLNSPQEHHISQITYFSCSATATCKQPEVTALFWADSH